MKNVKLNNGVEMPLLGFGTYLLKDGIECEHMTAIKSLDQGRGLIYSV